MQFKKRLTREQALQKLRQFCGYQERCHSETRDKLYDLGVAKSQHDEIIATLIEENYLNEERFAIAFARGKFRTRYWGKVKINYELRLRKISDYCIKKALADIDEEEYTKTLERLATKRYESLQDLTPAQRKNSTIEYLLGKGYEPVLVHEQATTFPK